MSQNRNPYQNQSQNQNHSQYRPLTIPEAIDYARRLEGVFGADAQLSCREIGDGNLNLVFHIVDSVSGKSIILKQALPYAKVVGDSWPLTLERARIESDALRIEERLCPGLVPHVHAYDPVLALTVMDDLSDHVIMRKGLIERRKFPLFAKHIGRFLANTLFFTSDLGMDQQQKKLQMQNFINPELCKITEDLIFDDPYTDSPRNNIHPQIRGDAAKLWEDKELHLQVALLREKFLTQAQALLHGDLHTGSIFVREDSTKVIDPEFAYYGPMGFDIGAVLANLLLNFAGQEGWSPDAASRADYREYLLQTVRDVWREFETNFRSLWDERGVDRVFRTPGYQDLYMGRLLKDTFGFTGCKIVRRIVGLAHVADIDTIADEYARTQAQRTALSIGVALIKRHQSASSIEEMLEIAKNCAE